MKLKNFASITPIINAAKGDKFIPNKNPNNTNTNGMYMLFI